MKKYSEYLYLMAAILVMGIYAAYYKSLDTMASYGMIGAIVLFSFLFSIRRTLRRIQESKKISESKSQSEE